MRPLLLSAVLAAVLLPSLPASAPVPGRLEVVVTGARNDRGLIRVALFVGPEGFPGHDEHALGRAVTPASTGPVTLVFRDVPPGEYAAAVLHDEDGNGRMRSNWLGMPREGYGTSNNPGGRPKYGKSRFHHDGKVGSLEIHLVYR